MSAARYSSAVAAALMAVTLGCDTAPRTAVIALHGLPEDQRYLQGMEDSLATGPHPVRVEIFDVGSVADAYRSALQRAQAVVRIPGLVAVVGHRDSRSTLVVGPIYQDAGIPLVVPNATSRAIADIGPLVFREVADDREEGAFIARVVLAGMDTRRVTVFHLADEFGIGIRDGVLSALSEADVTPLDVVEYGFRRVTCPDDFEALVDASMLHGLPDVVILAGRTPDASCIAREVAARAPGARFLAADGVNVGDALVEAAGPAAERMWVVQFWTPGADAASATFADDFERRAGIPADQGAALRWDGVRLLVAAIREVGADPNHVARYLRELGNTRPPYHGITGDISFGAHAHPLTVVDAAGRLVTPSGW